MRYHSGGICVGHVDTAEFHEEEDITLHQLCHDGKANPQQTDLNHSLRIHTLLQNYHSMTVIEPLVLSDFPMLVAPSPTLNSPMATNPPLIAPSFNLHQRYGGL
ncbi:hypothetical protein HDU99_006861, partial [Rhizoclosmatium hyalinum]